MTIFIRDIGEKGKRMVEFIKIYQEKDGAVIRSRISIDLSEVASYEEWGVLITRITLKGSHLCFKIEMAYEDFKAIMEDRV